MTTEGKEPMFEIDRTRAITMPQLIGYAVIIATNAFAVGIVWANLNSSIEKAASKESVQAIQTKVDQLDAYRATRTVTTDQNFKDIRQQLQPLTELQFAQTNMANQAVELKTQIVEANKRMDRIVELFGGKLDALSDSMAGLKSDVRLSSSKLDDLTQKVNNLTPVRRTKFNGSCPPEQPILVLTYCRSKPGTVEADLRAGEGSK